MPAKKRPGIYVAEALRVPEDTEVELAIGRERRGSYLFTFVSTWPFQSTFDRLYSMLSTIQVDESCQVRFSGRRLASPPAGFRYILWHGTKLEAVKDIWLDNGRMLETQGKGDYVGVWVSPDLGTASYFAHSTELLKGKFFLCIIQLAGDGDRSKKRLPCKRRPQWCMPSDAVHPVSVSFWRVHSTKAQRKGRPDIIDLEKHVDG